MVSGEPQTDLEKRRTKPNGDWRRRGAALPKIGTERGTGESPRGAETRNIRGLTFFSGVPVPMHRRWNCTLQTTVHRPSSIFIFFSSPSSSSSQRVRSSALSLLSSNFHPTRQPRRNPSRYYILYLHCRNIHSDYYSLHRNLLVCLAVSSAKSARLAYCIVHALIAELLAYNARPAGAAAACWL